MTADLKHTATVMGSNTVLNNAGGTSKLISDFELLDRFLILGSESNNYVPSKTAALKASEKIKALISKHGIEVVRRVVQISDEGRAPKNDQALFVLAMCVCSTDVDVRRYALENLPRVARIGTHLYQFVQYLKSMRGAGSRAVKTALSNWFLEMDVDRLAMNAVKYRQRDGWTYRDVLRICHAKTDDPVQNSILKFMVKNEITEDSPELLWAFDAAQNPNTDIPGLIRRVPKLPREALRTESLKDPDVWRAMLPNMPITAMIRNLATMTRNGAFKDVSSVDIVVQKLTDPNYLAAGRVHPIQILSALKVYSSGGHGGRSRGESFVPIKKIEQALDSAFYRTFKNVRPTGKRICLSVDVSGSMSWGEIAQVPGLTPQDAAAALALIFLKVEPHGNVDLFAFSTKLTPVNYTGIDTLQQMIDRFKKFQCGGTDASLPIETAIEKKVGYDAFISITDNETWAHRRAPSAALDEYNRKMHRNAAGVAIGMTATEFSVFDSSKPNQMNIVGFDSAGPMILNNFIAGNLSSS